MGTDGGYSVNHYINSMDLVGSKANIYLYEYLLIDADIYVPVEDEERAYDNLWHVSKKS